MLQKVLAGTDEWLAKAFIQTEDGTDWVLNYYIQHIEGAEGGRLYGLRVDKSAPDGITVESEATNAITESRETAFAMAEAFAKGAVPPSVLLEIADDWME